MFLNLRHAATLAGAIMALSAGAGIAQELRTPEEGGAVFASICQQQYPDVKEAQKAAQLRSYKYNKENGLFENDALGQEFRINKRRCGFRFLTNVSGSELQARFRAGAAQLGTPPQGFKLKVTSEDIGGGIFRVGATLDR